VSFRYPIGVTSLRGVSYCTCWGLQSSRWSHSSRVGHCSGWGRSWTTWVLHWPHWCFSDSVSSTSSPVATASETSDVAKNAPSTEIEVAPVVSSSGRVVRRIVHYKDTRRYNFFSLVVGNLSLCFCFFLVFNLVKGPLGPRTFVFLFLSLPFRGIHVGTPTNLEGGGGRSGPDLLLF
jgi:hypothetical protein